VYYACHSVHKYSKDTTKVCCYNMWHLPEQDTFVPLSKYSANNLYYNKSSKIIKESSLFITATSFNIFCFLYHSFTITSWSTEYRFLLASTSIRGAPALTLTSTNKTYHVKPNLMLFDGVIPIYVIWTIIILNPSTFIWYWKSSCLCCGVSRGFVEL
jgi:hypothetical protein